MWRILYCVVLLFTTVNTAGLGEVCSESDPCTDVLGLGESECVRVHGSCEPTCQCDANSYESTEHHTCQPVHECEEVGECANTIVGSTCNTETNTCECGDGIALIDYHGTDYCQLALIDDMCIIADDCLAHLIDPDTAVCDDEWTGGICACNVGWMQEPGYEDVACIKYPLGAECVVGESVCIDNASCSEDSICVCDDGFETNEDNICQNVLIPQENVNLPHGETCTTDVTVEGAFLCNTDLVCDECLAGDGLACQIPLKAIGSHCIGGIGGGGCDVGVCGKDFSDCTNGHCMCPEGQHATSYTACDDNVALGGECTYDLQCDAATHGATCDIPDGEDIGVCSCVEPLQLHDGDTPVCYHSAFQDNCSATDECLTYLLNPDTGGCVGTFPNQICGCVDGYVIDEEGVECRPYHYGEICLDLTSQCEGNSACVASGDYSRCLCSADTIWNYNIKNCLHKDASDHIIADRECTAHFDEANSQICEPWLTCGQCSDDGDEAPRVCRDADELGADPLACNPTDNNACKNHGDEAVCDAFYDHCEDTGVCECTDGHYLDSNWQCAPVGDAWSCGSSEQCDNFIRYSVCDPQGCSCRDDEIVHNVGEVQYCAKSHMGEACAFDDNCLSYRVNSAAGVCHLEGDNPGCGCTVDYKPDGEVCVQVSFGEACYSECSGSLVCEMHMVCECPHNTVWHVELGDCVHYEAVHVGPGDACDADYTVAGARICITPEVCAVCYGSDDGVGICSERTPSTTPFYEDTSFISLTTTSDEDPSFTRVTTPFDEDPSFTRVTTPFDENPSFTRVTACEKTEYQFCDVDMMAYDDTACQLYYVCEGGFWRSGLCQEPTLFDIESFACRPAASATCADLCPPFTGAPHPDPSLEPIGPCPEITGDNCEPQQNYPDRQSCSHYHHCVGAGTILETSCPENTFYNLEDQQCQAPDADFNCYRECETMATDSWGVV